MFRAIRLMIGAVVVLCGGFALAQPAKDMPTADGYFPLKAKTKWTYKVQDQVVVVAVVGTEKFNGEDCTKVDTLVNDKVVASELYAVRAEGVFRVKVKDDKVDPPVKVLALPVKKDASWPVNCKVGSQSITGNFKITAVGEKIKVMDKDTETVIVEGNELDVAGTKTTVKMWFAKDKGMVKLSYKINDAESVLELTKFDTPAGTN